MAGGAPGASSAVLRLADEPARYSVNQVLPFIVAYNLDVDEFAKSAFVFKTFNEFFYRALKPGGAAHRARAPRWRCCQRTGATWCFRTSTAPRVFM